jgi:hypothetical protein
MMIDEFAYVPAVQFEHAVPLRPFVDDPSGHAAQTSGFDDALMLFASVAQPPPRDERPAEQLAQTGPRSPHPEPLQPYCPTAHKRGHAEGAAVAETELVGERVGKGVDDREPDAVAVDDAVADEDVVLELVDVEEAVAVSDSASAAPTTAAASSNARSAPTARVAWRGMCGGRWR